MSRLLSRSGCAQRRTTEDSVLLLIPLMKAVQSAPRDAGLRGVCCVGITGTVLRLCRIDVRSKDVDLFVAKVDYFHQFVRRAFLMKSTRAVK